MSKVLIDFEHNGTKYSIVHPTQAQLMKIDLEQRRAFAEAIRAGLLAEFEAKKTFEAKGIWGEKQEAEIRDLQIQIATAEMNLQKEENEKKGKELAFELLTIRAKLLELTNDKTKLASQTAEGYAAEAKNVLFAALCTVDENLKPVFSTADAFMKHPDHDFTAKCFGFTMLADVGLTEADTKIEFAENKWLVDHGYMEGENPEFTQKYYTEALEDAAGIEVKPKENKKGKTAKKKRGRPKKAKANVKEE